MYSIFSRWKQGKVFVRISGGLGNQLFQVSAGKYCADKNSSELIIIIPNGYENEVKRNFDKELFANIKMIRQMRYLPFFRNFIVKFSSYLSKHSELLARYLAIDCPKEIGYSNSFMRLRGSIELRGYYQSHLYASHLPNKMTIRECEKTFSLWYGKHASKIKALGNVAALHVRGTDYLLHSKETGLLSQDYYQNAVLELQSDVEFSEIWVFSDDPIYAERILANINANFYFVKPPESSIDLESFVLISKCSSIIIGNSTFAWWSAWLSETATHVYCPDEWFRGLDDPKDLIPDTWRRVASSWA